MFSRSKIYRPDLTPATAQHRARRAFTFTEVMFAVIILGVGFVMIAAILPVAIQQSKSNVDDATAASFSQSAVSAIVNLPTTAPSAAPAGTFISPPAALFPPTTSAAATKGRLYYFGETAITVPPGSSPFDVANPQIAANPNLYLAPYEQINMLIGNMIRQSDPRFAWIGFYQRDLLTNTAPPPATVPAPYAKLTILTIQSRLQPTYTLDFTQSNYDFPLFSTTPTIVRVNATKPLKGTFRPQQVYVYLTERVDQPDVLTFASQSGMAPVFEPRAGEGAFVIIADTNASDAANAMPSGRNAGDLNGRVYRLGQASAQFPGSYELQPGYDMTYNATTGYHENVPSIAPTTTNTASPTTNKPPTSGVPAVAFIVGRGLPNGSAAEDDAPSSSRPGTGSNAPTGPVQDVSVYQCIVPLPQ